MSTMIDEDSVVMATSDHVACDMKGELLVLQMTSAVYYGLDPVANRVFSLILEPARVEAIRDLILEEYHVDRERCTRDLFGPLEKLAVKKLIEVRSVPVAQIL